MFLDFAMFLIRELSGSLASAPGRQKTITKSLRTTQEGEHSTVSGRSREQEKFSFAVLRGLRDVLEVTLLQGAYKPLTDSSREVTVP